MRKLGPEPLTGAEKQRRHRQRVKARLAEAERLRRRFEETDATFLGLAGFYGGVLAELGASAEEAEALLADLPALHGEIRDALRRRGAERLEILRARMRRRGDSLLSRLDASRG